jgi:glyceraldehyde 3-phosphate dehydrogenase
MAIKLAINGFGRIGRAAFKIAVESEDIDLVAVNDLADINNLIYLLRYDSVYGRYGKEVEVSGGEIRIGDDTVKVLSESDPTKLPWEGMEVDVVIESTGMFTLEEDARGHLEAGAKRVIVSAPTKSGGMSTVVSGVNDKDIKGKEIISNASCTTNCAAPVMSIMDGMFGVKKALLTTIHAYTSSQELIDGPNKKDFRRGRAAGINIVPASTGAAVAATKALPQLEDKFDGIAIRVPIPTVSIGDFTFISKKKVKVDDVNKAFIEASTNPLYQEVLSVTDDLVVSSDFVGDPHSAVVDLNMTRVVDGDLVKVMAWYDNEWGYSNRLVEQVIAMGKDI